jgi:hypothetical protein
MEPEISMLGELSLSQKDKYHMSTFSSVVPKHVDLTEEKKEW